MGNLSLEGVRVLHVHTLPVVSGSGINTFLSMRGCAGVGARVALACAPGGKLEELVHAEAMEFFPIRNFVSEAAPFKDLHALWQLDRLFRRERFDIVHTHNSKAGFLGRLAARRSGVPIIVHTVHGFAFHDAESWPRRRLFAALERWAARWCDQMIAISQPMIEWAERERIAPPESFELIYSGIEVDRFRDAKPDPELQQSFGIIPGEIVLGVVSKLWEGKGHEVLLDAVAGLLEGGHRIRLLIVGEGALETRLKERVRQLGIGSAVTFTGFRADVPEVTALLDISVLPSFYEGMGRVVLEAMAAGKPVIASRVGGIPDLMEDGISGFLVPPGDTQALAERIECFLNNPALRVRMGEQAGRQVRGEHSAEVMVSRIHEVYCRLLAERGKTVTPPEAIAGAGPDPRLESRTR